MRPAHEMILASAGSGKTYALTHRFVELLAHGAPPERIVALTFTRKAAGEFFDKILEKLAQAATDPAKAARLAQDIRLPHLRPADFLRLLRAMVDAMPQLNLGTLDGFFARVVRAFPLELGLDGEFEIMDEATARRERRRVLRRMFAAAGGELTPAQREFIEAFKRATFGLEEKRMALVLDRFLDEHAEKFLDAPGLAQWGQPATIWPEGVPWLAAVPAREAAVQQMRAALGELVLTPAQRRRFDDFFLALEEWSPGAPLPKPVEYLLKNALAEWPELRAMTVTKRIELTDTFRLAFRGVIEGIAGAELERRLHMTQGIFAVLRGYEGHYHDAVRRAGLLTFADVLRLLLPENENDPRRLSSGGAGEGGRLVVDWRLDAKFDHWLLDEFQDTSYAQWSVLANLIDEAIQDTERARSLFYVGDVKQAIFAWRGGDPGLFREIFRRYNDFQDGLIAERRLDESWRSGPAVIAMVNQVFGDVAALGELLPAPAAAAWQAEWRPHISAQPRLGGVAELRWLDPGEGDGETARFAETLKILREVEPLQRGLDVAILVPENGVAAALADYLRREGGLPAVAESDLHIATDNPLTGALLALLRAAAHPGDSLAHGHVNMSPLEARLLESGLATADQMSTKILGQIHELGFAGTLEHWLRELEPALAGDAFSQERGRMLVSAAAQFDETGSRDVMEFLDFAERFTVRDADATGVVRVMTIHKSKGLGFDVVILPDLEGRSLATRRRGLAVEKAEDRATKWVLELPTAMFAESDPVLAAHLRQASADAAYENLCLLYVAMTRAKRAMYIVAERVKADSKAKNFTRLLRDALGDAWREGDPRWFASVAAAPTEVIVVREPGRLGPNAVARAPRRPARTPSGQKPGEVNAAALFSLETGADGRESSAVEFGHAVHEFFADVEWLGGDATAETLAAAWAKRGDELARSEALACVGAPELAPVWTRTGHADVWRERGFEVVIDGAWVTGIFDRVVVERAGEGVAAVRATVFDFKTDRLEKEADLPAAVLKHAPQLNLYRRVVALLAGLPVEAVSCELIFTRLRRRAVVPRN